MTDQGTVAFQVRVVAFNSHSTEKIRFQVEDTGVGISSQEIEKIFQAFEQTSKGKKKAQRTGLGLP